MNYCVVVLRLLVGVPVDRDELSFRLHEWMQDEFARNPAVAEAESYVGYAALAEEDRQHWHAQVGDLLALEVTDERLDRFLAENPDIAVRGIVDA